VNPPPNPNQPIAAGAMMSRMTGHQGQLMHEPDGTVTLDGRPVADGERLQLLVDPAGPRRWRTVHVTLSAFHVALTMSVADAQITFWAPAEGRLRWPEPAAAHACPWTGGAHHFTTVVDDAGEKWTRCACGETEASLEERLALIEIIGAPRDAWPNS
jgi:hypothetical protein